MKTIAFDNSCDADLSRTITWQFDKAVHFVGIINLLKDFVNQSTKTFWDDIVTKVGNLDTADEFGLAVWGRLLNLPRPILTIEGTRTDTSVYYSKYLGIMTKVNESHTASGSTIGFYFHNDNYDLIPYTTQYGNYRYAVYKTDEPTYVSTNTIANLVVDSLDVDPIPFTQYRINGVWVQSADIEGGCPVSHTYPYTSQQAISTELYRKVLKGRFALLNGNTALGIIGNASVSDYCKYISYVFDGKVTVSDSLDMALTFTKKSSLTGEMEALFDQCRDVIIPYPSGVHDNVLSGSLRFKLTSTNTPSASAITADHMGGLSNSSFTWN